MDRDDGRHRHVRGADLDRAGLTVTLSAARDQLVLAAGTMVTPWSMCVDEAPARPEPADLPTRA